METDATEGEARPVATDPPGTRQPMQLSPTPDLSPRRRLLATALVVTLAVWMNLVGRVHDIVTDLGDTDDAMRLVQVRDLLHGQGWYDQWVGRLQPPHGVYLHWSRLLDGALAAMDALLRTVMSPATAEFVMRFAWPLLWIFPVVLAGLAVARNLGGRSATFIAAIFLVLDVAMFMQFRPGRVDHHDIQITLTMAAMACALMRGEHRVRWACLAGASAALCLAIGIEALAFHGLIGASFGLRWLMDRSEAKAARAYGATLAAGALALFLAQTPPVHWLTFYCDALGANLVLTLLLAGGGLALALTSLLPDAGFKARLAATAAVGLAAAVAYVGMDPMCLKGPFGSVDPRVRPFWFDHIQELEPWPVLLKNERNEAIHSITIGILGLIATGWLVVRAWREPKRGDWLLAACTLVAVYAESKAYRMEDYGLWFGTPALTVLLSDVATRWLKDKMVLVGALAVLLSPTTVVSATVLTLHLPKAKPAPADHCYETARYAHLAALPPGLVMAEPDLGPFTLANTQDSVLSAPYHRMTWGILTAHDVLATPSGPAEAQTRALGVTYVLDCPVHKLREPPGGLGDDIRRGRAPAWLRRLSAPAEPLQIYEVIPKTAGKP